MKPELPVEVEEFLSYVSAEKGLSQNTYSAYAKDLEQFHVFCKSRSVAFQKVELSHLREFVASLRHRELSSRSIARKVSAVKQFYVFLLREGKTEQNPSELLQVLVKEKKLPKHLSMKEVNRLVEAPTGDSELSIRDRALLELWYATGVRVSELASIEVDDFDWKKGVVKVTGKGGRERWIPIHTAALAWCQKYKGVRHEWVRRLNRVQETVFFLNARGTPFSRQTLSSLIKGYAKKAGIGKRLWPHMIRHSFATHVLRGGADLRVVQELLGHKSIATTEIYTHLNVENLKVMQTKFHPRN